MQCLFCLSISGAKRISPGLRIYEGIYWLVDHAYPTSMLCSPVILSEAKNLSGIGEPDSSLRSE